MKPHRGALILVLGILGIVTCFPLGIAAWIMGRKDLKRMEAGTMDPAGRDQTNAGCVCGMIGTVLAGILLLASLACALVWLLWNDSPAMVPRQGPLPHAEGPSAVEVVVPGQTKVVLPMLTTRSRGGFDDAWPPTEL